ncbi:MAG: transcriptional regulator [Gammaproteobacteria bacterium RIFCSPHIGHO2_12_FULL_43_28]|nr:MAG: transcriptional regulator [Gammaproteobacteria bacterium RIFCSPHIGHO2_12_FULL_43_28]
MATLRKNSDLKKAINHWKYIANDIHEPLNQNDYGRLTNILDHLLDTVGEDEKHELIGLVDVISHMITMYDEKHNYHINTSGISALKFLMEQHNLKQSDLPEIGSQGVVSEILNGKRQLNLTQIKKLAKRFHVSVDTFIN